MSEHDTGQGALGSISSADFEGLVHAIAVKQKAQNEL
jgi:hypothetical protein